MGAQWIVFDKLIFEGAVFDPIHISLFGSQAIVHIVKLPTPPILLNKVGTQAQPCAEITSIRR